MRYAPSLLCSFLLVVGLSVGPATAQPNEDATGTIAAVSGETVRIELADAITVEAGVEGRVVQERTIAGAVRQINAALFEVTRVERPAAGPWVAVAQITNQTQPVKAGDGAEFEETQPRPATLSVQSDPSGAVVYLDGTRVGVTPAEVDVAPGRRQLRLEKEGYRTATRGISVGAGQQRDLTVALAEAPRATLRSGEERQLSIKLDVPPETLLIKTEKKSVIFEYLLAKRQEVSLTIFNTLGFRVWKVGPENQTKGAHRVLWNRRGDDGETVTPGVYLCLLKTSSYTATERLVIKSF